MVKRYTQHCAKCEPPHVIEKHTQLVLIVDVNKEESGSGMVIKVLVDGIFMGW